MNRQFWWIPALLLATGFARLGVWQLDRAAFKRESAQQYAASLRQPLTDFQGGFAKVMRSGAWMPVRISGHFVNTKPLFLDNQPHLGKPGAWLLARFQMDGVNGELIVIRGWVPWKPDRTMDVANWPVSTAESLRGLLAPPPKPGLRLGNASSIDAAGHKLFLALAPEEMQKELGVPILPLVLYEESADGDGLVREWAPANGFPPQRHQGYAVQWFALALTVLIVAGILLTRKEKIV
jgi:surfeit locus 1 family protein